MELAGCIKELGEPDVARGPDVAQDWSSQTQTYLTNLTKYPSFHWVPSSTGGCRALLCQISFTKVSKFSQSFRTDIIIKLVLDMTDVIYGRSLNQRSMWRVKERRKSDMIYFAPLKSACFLGILSSSIFSILK